MQIKKNIFSTILLSIGFLILPNFIYALPKGEEVVVGSAIFDHPDSNTLNIDTSSEKIIINYNSFSIDQQEAVHFNQPSTSSIALNRVVGVDPSSIMGTLTANGRIFLVNPNGVIFGSNSHVDVAALVASTLNITDDDFLNGRYNFFKDGKAASILNQGNLTIRNGGYVCLLSQAVENQGTIQANLGTVVVASGEKMILALDDLGQISVVIDESAREAVFGPQGQRLDSAIKNSGIISANGGKVLLTAKVLNNVFDYAINNSGIIEAKSLVERNGVIELVAEGAPIINIGKIITDGSEVLPDGGRVSIEAATILHRGIISANAFEEGTAGEIIIISQNSTVLDEGSRTEARALGIVGNGGRITINSTGGNTVVDRNAIIDVSAGLQAGNAGFIEVSAFEQLGFYGILNGRAPPGYQAATVFFDPTDLIIDSDINQVGTYTGVGDNIYVSADIIVTDGNIILTATSIFEQTSGIIQTNNSGNIEITGLTVKLLGTVISAGDLTITGRPINASDVNSIQTAINAIGTVGGTSTINVAAGTYDEKLSINKSLILRGNDPDNKPLINLPAEDNAGVTITASNVTLENLYLKKEYQEGWINSILSIPRGGGWGAYTIAYENITLRNLIFEGGQEGAYITAGNLTIEDCQFIGQSADAVYLDAVSGTTNILRNYFEGGATSKRAILFENFTEYDPPESGTINIQYNTINGMRNFVVYNQWIDLTTKVTLNITNNKITNVVGDVISFFVDPDYVPSNYATKFNSVVIRENDFSGVTDTNFAISLFELDESWQDVRVDNPPAASGGIAIDASVNYWGASSGPSGAGSGTGAGSTTNIDFTPFLVNGTDISTDTGFQGDFSELTVTALESQTGSTGRIQEGIDLVTSSGTVNVLAGTYNEEITVNKGITLLGAQANVEPKALVNGIPSGTLRTGDESVLTGTYALTIRTSNVTVNGFEFDGFRYGINVQAEAGTTLENISLKYNYMHSDKAWVGIVVGEGYAGTGDGTFDNILITHNAIDVSASAGSDPYALAAIDFTGATTYFDFVTFKNVEISYNYLTNPDYSYGIFCGATTDAYRFDAPVIKWNYIYHCDAGINVGNMYDADINNNLFEDNPYAGAQIGVLGGSVANNVFKQNYPSPYDDYPSYCLTFWGTQYGFPTGSNSVTVTGNDFYFNNYDSITKPDYGVRVLSGCDASTITFIQNRFYDGGAIDGALALKNYVEGVDLNASGNWWGTNIPEDVAAVVSANVDYSPWLDNGIDTDSGTAGFQPDFSILYVDDDSPQTGSTGRIQEAIDLVTTAGTVNVAAGTYDETIDINKRITLQGAGSSDTGTVLQSTNPPNIAGVTYTQYNPVVILSASGIDGDPVLLKDLMIRPRQDIIGAAGQIPGILIRPGDSETSYTVSYVELNNVRVIGTESEGTPESGVRVDGSTNLYHFVVNNCEFSDMAYGMIFHNYGDSPTTVQYMEVSDTTFDNNSIKGFYAEKLSDATFTNVTVTNNGNIDLSPSWADPWNAGIDINLKYGAYQNLMFNNLTVTGNGIDSTNGVGLTVKARGTGDDSSYSSNPATLLGVVTVNGGTFTGNEAGMRFGEPGKDNTSPANITVNNATISGNTQFGLYNVLSGVTVDATKNYWGDATGPNHEDNPSAGLGDAVSDNVDFIVWYATATTRDNGENVSVDHPGDSIIAYSDTIQGGIDAAISGDTVNVAAGTYNEFISISGKSDLTIQSTHGAANTIIDVGDKGVYSTPSGVIEVRADGLTLDGFTIQNANGGEVGNCVFAGIYFPSGIGCTFKNLIIKNIEGLDRAEGIHLGGDSSTFSNITISDLTELPGGGGCNSPGAFGLITNGADNNIFNDITISNLVSNDNGNASGLITFNSFKNNTFNNMIIQDLTSYGTSNSDGILLLSYWHSGDVVDNTFTDTTISGINAEQGRACGIRSAADSSKKIIGTNFIDTYINNVDSNTEAYGIYNSHSEGTTMTGGQIQGLTAPTTNGVYILGSTSTASIENMAISGADYGITINSDVDAGQVSAHYNNIVGNTYSGVKNDAVGQVDATKNYWGDARGPQHSSSPHTGVTTGDSVSDNVTFMPWYATSTTTSTTQYVSVDHPGDSIIAYSDTIQGGIDAAVAGDTVNVGVGTYTENISISKSLTMISDTGNYRTTGTILTGGMKVAVSAGNVTIQGFKFQDVSNKTVAGANGLITAVGDNLTVRSNSFENIEGHAVLAYTPGIQHGWLITDNNISNVTYGQMSGLFLDGLEDSIISSNVIDGTPYSGIILCNAANDTISDNIIRNIPQVGIQVSDAQNITIKDNYITNANTVNATDKGAISFYPSVTNSTVTNNTLVGNYQGFTIRDKSGTVSADIHVNYNTIYDNGGYGVGNFAQGGGTLDASSNYWGDVDPSNDVSANVDYSPWWGVDYVDDPHESSWAWYTNDSIQDAIDVASDTVQDTINVLSGTYAENIIIDKRITIQGAGSGSDPATNTVVTPGSEFVNLTIAVGGSSETERLVIKDIYFSGTSNKDGLRMLGPGTISYVTLQNIVVENYEHGAQLLGNDADPLTVNDLEVISSSFSNNNQKGFGIGANHYKNVTVNGVKFIDCEMVDNFEAGLYIWSIPSMVTDLEITRGTYTGATQFGDIAILGGLSGGTITDVTAGEGAASGILFWTYGPVSDVTITNPTISGVTSSSGITFYNATGGSIADITVTGGSITGNAYGVSIYSGSTGVIISDISFQNNNIQVRDEAEVMVIEDVLTNNTFDRAVTVDHIGSSPLHTIWSSIQDGVDAASSGDTVNVASGSYGEDVNIGQALTVTGSDNPSTTSFTLTANPIIITGFDVDILNISGSGKIQEGINAVNTNGTVNVAAGAGTYIGDVDINKALTVQLLGDTTSIGDFTNNSGTLDVNDNKLTIDGDLYNYSLLRTSSGGDIVLDISGNAKITDISTAGASSGLVNITAGGYIKDAGDSETDIIAKDLILKAASIGTSSDALDTDVSSLNASSTNNGSIYINEADDLLIDKVDAGTGNVGITAVAGAITQDGDAAADVVADALTANAQGRIDLDTAVGSLTAHALTAGNIIIDETDVVILTDIDTVNGNITIISGGQMTARDVAAGGSGDISLTTSSGNILLGTITASGNDVTLTSAGAINDNNAGNNNITALNLILSAANGIGLGGDELETSVSNLKATNTTSGNIDIDNTGNLILGTIRTPGNIIISTSGDITVLTGTVASTAGGVNLIANSGSIYATGSGLHLEAAANSLLSASGVIGTSTRSFGVLLTDGDCWVTVFGVKAGLSANLSGTTPSETVVIYNCTPSGVVSFNNFAIWPVSLNNQSSTNLVVRVNITTVTENLSDSQVNSFDMMGSVYFHHPVTETDTSAFDDFQVTEDMYEFIEGTVRLREEGRLLWLEEGFQVEGEGGEEI